MKNHTVQINDPKYIKIETNLKYSLEKQPITSIYSSNSGEKKLKQILNDRPNRQLKSSKRNFRDQYLSNEEMEQLKTMRLSNEVRQYLMKMQRFDRYLYPIQSDRTLKIPIQNEMKSLEKRKNEKKSMRSKYYDNQLTIIALHNHIRLVYEMNRQIAEISNLRTEIRDLQRKIYEINNERLKEAKFYEKTLESEDSHEETRTKLIIASIENDKKKSDLKNLEKQFEIYKNQHQHEKQLLLNRILQLQQRNRTLELDITKLNFNAAQMVNQVGKLMSIQSDHSRVYSERIYPQIQTSQKISNNSDTLDEKLLTQIQNITIALKISERQIVKQNQQMWSNPQQFLKTIQYQFSRKNINYFSKITQQILQFLENLLTQFANYQENINQYYQQQVNQIQKNKIEHQYIFKKEDKNDKINSKDKEKNLQKNLKLQTSIQSNKLQRLQQSIQRSAKNSESRQKQLTREILNLESIIQDHIEQQKKYLEILEQEAYQKQIAKSQTLKLCKQINSLKNQFTQQINKKQSQNARLLKEIQKFTEINNLQIQKNKHVDKKIQVKNRINQATDNKEFISSERQTKRQQQTVKNKFQQKITNLKQENMQLRSQLEKCMKIIRDEGFLNKSAKQINQIKAKFGQQTPSNKQQVNNSVEKNKISQFQKPNIQLKQHKHKLNVDEIKLQKKQLEEEIKRLKQQLNFIKKKCQQQNNLVAQQKKTIMQQQQNYDQVNYNQFNHIIAELKKQIKKHQQQKYILLTQIENFNKKHHENKILYQNQQLNNQRNFDNKASSQLIYNNPQIKKTKSIYTLKPDPQLLSNQNNQYVQTITGKSKNQFINKNRDLKDLSQEKVSQEQLSGVMMESHHLKKQTLQYFASQKIKTNEFTYQEQSYKFKIQKLKQQLNLCHIKLKDLYFQNSQLISWKTEVESHLKYLNIDKNMFNKYIKKLPSEKDNHQIYFKEKERIATQSNSEFIKRRSYRQNKEEIRQKFNGQIDFQNNKRQISLLLKVNLEVDKINSADKYFQQKNQMIPNEQRYQRKEQLLHLQQIVKVLVDCLLYRQLLNKEDILANAPLNSIQQIKQFVRNLVENIN